MSRVVHFEIHADDPARAAEFYTKVFGWKIVKWEGNLDYWLITTGDDKEPGINGALMKRQGRKYPDMAVIGYVCTVQVDNIDEYMKKAEKSGGVNAVPKNTIPGVGYVAYFQDTEGNVFGIHQEDRSAK